MNLLPKDEIFYSLFIKSAKKVNESALILQQMMQDISNISSLEAKAKRVKEIEDECDKNTHEILSQLNKSFVTPLDREDIYLIAKELDEIVDYIEDAAYWIMSINVKEVRKEAETLCALIVKSGVEVQKIMEAMKDTKKIKELSLKIIEVNRLENEGDSEYRLGLRRLFTENIAPIDVLKWKEVFGLLENALDACEHVANTVEGVVMKHA